MRTPPEASSFEHSTSALRRLRTASLSCVVALACGGTPDEGGSSGGAPSTKTGGSSAGGASSGSTSLGGNTTGGANRGGNANSGGTTTTSGGSTAQGGISSGGANPGGNGSGGSQNSGGSTQGQGGRSNAGSGGGSSSGGSSSGGRASGGAMGNSGGAANQGGRASGGSTSGGANGTGGSSSGCTATGFYVKGGALYDSKCNEFVMRGVNYPYAWFASRNAQQDLSAIAGTGANSVRIVLATGARWTKTSASTLSSLISAAKAAKLVSVVEVHDTTGYSEQSGSVALSNATSYWTASDIASALKGQEAYVILNLANEPNGNNTSSSWASSHVTAVGALRNAGFNHTLMVDGPNWAQDWQFTMRDGGGASIWNADSKKNLVFSVHMYDVFETSSIVSSYFNAFLMRYEAPLVVGEFASDHGSAGNVDEASIMSLAQNLGIGYLGWSWAGNSSDLASLNITNNFNASSLTAWGTRLINGENGIKATSKPCTCFN